MGSGTMVRLVMRWRRGMGSLDPQRWKWLISGSRSRGWRPWGRVRRGRGWRGWCRRSLSGRLLPLGAVLATALLAVAGAGGVQRSADDVVADAGDLLDAAAADQHHRVLLEIVPDPGDVGGHLDLAGQPDAGHLAEGRVGLLGGGRVDAHADATALGRPLEGRRLGLLDDARPAFADQLLDGGHVS